MIAGIQDLLESFLLADRFGVRSIAMFQVAGRPTVKALDILSRINGS